MNTPSSKKTLRYTSDPVLLSMSDDEYIAALEALGGSAPDDNLEESIEALNAILNKDLEKIYNVVSDPDTHP
ncbi:MAG: hypothetical protein CVU44_11100 [Chloroflexi bacterium HGW-Chloroflexi-6]|nr:MAG: hypothetical protein CVU44_11100 [Chloroflexi bacterium HGW-Chloroflexi-6]